MKKLKESEVCKVGDIVQLKTDNKGRYAGASGGGGTVLSPPNQRFGLIEELLNSDECLVTHISKIKSIWRKTVRRVPHNLKSLKPHPNKQLTQSIKNDLDLETGADIINSWLSQE